MDQQEIELINKSTKLNKFKNFIKYNSKLLILFILIILLIIGFYFFNIKSNYKSKIDNSNKFNKVILSHQNNQNINVSKELIEIITSKDKTYSPLALYYLIENNLIDSKQEINKYFDLIINDLDLETNIKKINIYKKALYNADKATEKDLFTILEPLLSEKSIWKSHATYLLAEFYYKNGEKLKAKNYYNDIIGNNESNEEIRIEAQKRIQRDLSD